MISLLARIAIAIITLRAEPRATLETDAATSVRADVFHVQGLDLDARFYWITGVNRARKKGLVIKIDRASGKIDRQRDITLGSRYHPGGFQKVGEHLWIPVAEYRPSSTTTVLKLSAETLAEVGRFAVDDHIGAIAGLNGRLYAANWDARTIYVLREDGAEEKRLPNPTGVAYQDMKGHDGALLACGPLRTHPGKPGIVDRIDPDSGNQVKRYWLTGQRRTPGGFGDEGFAVGENAFWLLPEDSPAATIYRFPFTSKSDKRGKNATINP